MEAIAARRQTGKIVLVGFDASREALRAIEAGQMNACEAAGRDADPHTALYDGQQRFATQFQKIQARRERDGPQGRRHFGRIDVG